MQYIGTEKYNCNGRYFAINLYKNNIADEILIESVEVTNGSNIILLYKGHVPMNGQLNLSPEKYPKYKEEIIAVKNSIIIFSLDNL